MPSFHLISLGCAKNRVDSEVVLADLSNRGFEPINEPSGADIIIVNTCGFIQPAVEEAIDHLLQAAKLKEEGQAKYVIGLGCLPQRYGKELNREMTEVDLFIPAGSINKAGQIIDDFWNEGIKKIIKPETGWVYDSSTPRIVTTGPGWAYVKISEGCPNRCAYCTIPMIRGPQISRSVDDIVNELSMMCQSGIVEANLVAQDLTAYGSDSSKDTDIVDLLNAIENTPSAPPWIRLLYLNPGLIDDRFIELIAKSKRILPYFDIPLQHAHPRIIKKMGRKPPAEDIAGWIRRLKIKIPGLILRTTLMTGFPGETEDDHKTMLDLIEQVEFDHLGVFSYCPEPDTKAASMKNQINHELAEERKLELMTRQEEISYKKNKIRVGQTVDVLVEGVHPESDLMLSGRSWFQAPEVDGSIILTDGTGITGKIQKAVITDAHPYDLIAELISNED